ncbi:MAG: acetyl-CoA hydrolase/transferase C-terminal domain-containing protein [Acidobacteriota bacterium]
MSEEFLQRIRSKELREKVTSPREAARLIRDGMTLGIGVAPHSACPKTFFRALAEEFRGKGKIRLLTGGPAPYEVDGLLAEAEIYERRLGQFSDGTLLKAANERKFPVVDTRTGVMPHHVRDGRYGKIDVAVIQAALIREDGGIVPTTTCLDAPSYTVLADKIIVEINPEVPAEIEGIHDIYIPEVAPRRRPIPLTHAGERIGVPYIPVDSGRIAAILCSEIPDTPPQSTSVDSVSQKIADHLVDFFEREVKRGRLPRRLLPLQFGIGNIPNALTKTLSPSAFSDLEIYTGAFGDGGLDLIDVGKVRSASASGLYLSREGFERFYRDLPRYKKTIVLRPVVVADCPEVIARLGCIAVNGAIEVDIYGHANSSHIQGSRLLSGVGGSCDFLWNAYLSILVLPSVTRKGAISCIVPMVSHVDHPEHCIDIVITDQGLADLRGLAPVERAERIIQNCAHPDYRDYLRNYLEEAVQTTGGHEPHLLGKAFQLHLEYARKGTMRLD